MWGCQTVLRSPGTIGPGIHHATIRQTTPTNGRGRSRAYSRPTPWAPRPLRRRIARQGKAGRQGGTGARSPYRCPLVRRGLFLDSTDMGRGMIAALYVIDGGVYSKLDHCDPWPESRRAELYSGPWPIVAHPPCGPWGRLHHRCTKQNPALGLRAVAQVEQWGGVLEHPADSKLWRAAGLPLPGFLPDRFGRFSIAVNQSDWGHRAPKDTWLYICGLRGRLPSVPPKRVAPSGRVENLSKRQRKSTPREFARWLAIIAAKCGGAQ